MDVFTDGEMASEGDFFNVKIYGSDGNEVTPAVTPEFWPEDYEYPVCDCTSGSCSNCYTGGYTSGFWTKFEELSADTYTISVGCADGTISTQVAFQERFHFLLSRVTPL